MIVDCVTCPVRGSACADCAVGVVLDTPSRGLPLDAAERRAVHVFVACGLLPAARTIGLRAHMEPWMDAEAVG